MNQYVLPIMAATMVALTTKAQDWARPRLEKSPRHLEWVKVKHGEREVNCFIAYPEVKDKVPAVVVIHEIFGLTDWVRGVTDQLAEAGYIAIAPDLLSGAAPGGGGTAELAGNDAVRKAISSLPPAQVTADLDAVVDYVAHLPSCNGKVAVAGFCWGGGQTFRFATHRKGLAAAFSFYGPMPEIQAEIDRIDCPVYGFYGGKDERINAGIPKAAEMMRKAGKVYQPVTYDGAGHGFMRAGEDPADTNPANKTSRDASWKRLKELLQKL